MQVCMCVSVYVWQIKYILQAITIYTKFVTNIELSHKVGVHVSFWSYVGMHNNIMQMSRGEATKSISNFHSLCLHEQFVFLLQFFLQIVQLYLELYVLRMCVHSNT